MSLSDKRALLVEFVKSLNLTEEELQKVIDKAQELLKAQNKPKIKP